MADLWDSVALLAVALHRDRIEAIAGAISCVPSWGQFSESAAAFGPGTDPVLIDGLKKAWADAPEVSGRQIGSALKAAARAAALTEAAESVNLVWTGSKTGFIPTRNTEQVIREVIDQSERQLFVVSYVFHNATPIVESLNDATSRGVSVRILLESPLTQGGATSGDGLASMRRAVPRAELFVWDPIEKSRIAGSLSASVHAKCAVADSRVAFVTSANLTSAAMERNMELGVLVRGGQTPRKLQEHLHALIVIGVIVPWR